MITKEEIENNKHIIEELRRQILDEINNKNVPCHPKDIDKLKSDFFVGRFVLFKKGNLKDALPLLRNCLKWRLDTKVNEITSDSIPSEIFQSKNLFPCNRDKDGNVIFIVGVRYHRRDAKLLEQLKKYLTYWGERLEREVQGGQYTVIFDLKDAGLKNLDFDLIGYLIELFKYYYPHTIAWLLIFEMPWFFNAAWKIIKAWLPPELVERTRFVDRQSIREYIEEDALVEHMGGTFQVPEKINMLEYKFEDQEYEDEPDSNSSSSPPNLVHSNSFDSTSQSLAPFPAATSKSSGLLSISTVVEFEEPQDGLPSDSYIHISNLLEARVAYKVRTNNVNLFKVRGPTGVLEPRQTARIPVQLLSVTKLQRPGRFQVLALKLEEGRDTVDHHSIWQPSNPDISVHVIRCIIRRKEPPVSKEMTASPSLESISTTGEIERLTAKLGQVERTLQGAERRDTIRNIILFVFLAILVIHHYLIWQELQRIRSTDLPPEREL